MQIFAYSLENGLSKIYIQIVLILYDNQFCSMNKIYSFFENKNYNIIKNIVDYLVHYKIIFKVPCWQGTAYYVNVDGDKTIKILVNYHITKHRVSSKIQKIATRHLQLREKFLQVGIKDFNKITRTNIPKKSIDDSGLDTGCTAVVKYLNLIILATRILILEEKSSKPKLHLVKRHDRICGMWLDLESFLEEYFGKTTPEAEFMAMAKSGELENKQQLYKKYFSHITHSKTTFSEYADLLRQIKLGHKQEYADSKGVSLQILSKIVTNFTDNSGHLKISYLSEMLRIETAGLVKIHDNEIEDLFFIDLFSEELSRTRISFYKDDEKEAEKIRKIAKDIYPEFQIVK